VLLDTALETLFCSLCVFGALSILGETSVVLFMLPEIFAWTDEENGIGCKDCGFGNIAFI